jgi:hypothetical protein
MSRELFFTPEACRRTTGDNLVVERISVRLRKRGFPDDTARTP